VKGNSTITNYRGEYTGKIHKESGLFHGRGTLVTPAGDKYSGEWLDGELNGHGLYAGGKQDDQYEGEWKNGKMDGIGKFKWANGDCYEGNWSNNRAEGRGVYIWKNRDRYEGEFKDNKKNGRGKKNL